MAALIFHCFVGVCLSHRLQVTDKNGLLADKAMAWHRCMLGLGYPDWESHLEVDRLFRFACFHGTLKSDNLGLVVWASNEAEKYSRKLMQFKTSLVSKVLILGCLAFSLSMLHDTGVGFSQLCTMVASWLVVWLVARSLPLGWVSDELEVPKWLKSALTGIPEGLPMQQSLGGETYIIQLKLQASLRFEADHRKLERVMEFCPIMELVIGIWLIIPVVFLHF